MTIPNIRNGSDTALEAPIVSVNNMNAYNGVLGLDHFCFRLVLEAVRIFFVLVSAVFILPRVGSNSGLKLNICIESIKPHLSYACCNLSFVISIGKLSIITNRSIGGSNGNISLSSKTSLLLLVL